MDRTHKGAVARYATSIPRLPLHQNLFTRFEQFRYVATHYKKLAWIFASIPPAASACGYVNVYRLQ